MATRSSENFRYLLKLLRQRQHAGFENNLSRMRHDLDAFGAQFPSPSSVGIEAMTLGGRPAEMLSPPGHHNNTVLLYLHGGGYVMGSIRSHRQLAAHLSAAAKMQTLIIDYRLAPEHPFPAALEDALSAYRSILSNGLPTGGIMLAGDSAGGGLCVSLLTFLKKKRWPLPGACVLMSPWVDLSMRGNSWHRNAPHDVLVNQTAARRMASLYLNGRDAIDPMASPLYADLSMLPPLLVQVGSNEVLMDDAVALHEKAKRCGVSSFIEIWDGMPHVWQFMSPILKEGRTALQHAAEFLMTHIREGLKSRSHHF